MAKTVAEKLLIKPDSTLWVSHADRLDLLGPLPEGVHTVDSLDQATTGLIFGDDASSLSALLEEKKNSLTKPEHLWVAYPKGNKTDINRDTLWPMVAAHGMRPIGQIAVDEVWSALRFRPLKEGEPQFNPGGNE